MLLINFQNPPLRARFETSLGQGFAASQRMKSVIKRQAKLVVTITNCKSRVYGEIERKLTVWRLFLEAPTGIAAPYLVECQDVRAILPSCL